MSDKPFTKKFPVSIGMTGQPSSRSEFFIPYLVKPPKNVFLGLKSGKEISLGCVSYIGMKVDSNEVISKLEVPPKGHRKAIRIIDDFIRQLQVFNIGNIISIEYKDDGSFILIKEASRQKPRKETRKLP